MGIGGRGGGEAVILGKRLWRMCRGNRGPVMSQWKGGLALEI